jgi:endonuclease YncB( thermonuclease family)
MNDDSIWYDIRMFCVAFAWTAIIGGGLLGYASTFAMESTKKHERFYKWAVIDVHDGDTITVNKKFYPEELGNIKIRINGIDTGEIGYRAKCNHEAKKAQEAKDYVTNEVLNKTITVKNITADKYGSRIVADVYIGGVRLADDMISKGLALPYDGGTKQSWCK